MQKLLYDFIPVLLFFIAFKFYDIYTATVIGITITALQVLITAGWQRRIDKQQVITLIIFVIFGGMTLYFHNPIFVKWKPTVVFWIFALIFLITQFIGKKPLIQHMLGSMLDEKASVPVFVWKKLNIAWTVFFIILGTVNIYIAYSFSTDTWVNFKFYGITGLMVLFSFLQAACLAKYLEK